MMGAPCEHDDAVRVANAAGDVLMRLRSRLHSNPDSDPDRVRRLGDYLSHRSLVTRLAELYPNDGVLSEEGQDDQSRHLKSRVWIVDPLDGTREFGEPGRTDWAVHVALVVDCVPVAGAVAMPARGITLSTWPPPPTVPRASGSLRVVVSRSRPPELCVELARRLDGELLSMGSAGVKAMSVVLGETDVYVHAGGQWEWDSAAPVAVAMAAGLHVSRVDGTPLTYNQPRPWLPDLLVCRPILAHRVLRILGELTHSSAR